MTVKKVIAIAQVLIMAIMTTSACGDQQKTGQALPDNENTVEIGDSSVPMAMRPASDCPNKVIFDTDIMYLNDDALALFMLTQADKKGELELLGVTTTGGNTYIQESTAQALQQLGMIGREDIPVYPGTDIPFGQGSSGYAEMDTENPTAWDFIIDQVHRYPGEVTIMAVGPATNVAIALTKDPTIAEDAAGIIYLGGDVDAPGSPGTDFNWCCDPEAAKVCLAADWKSQLILTNKFKNQLMLDKSVFDRIRELEQNEVTSLILSLADGRSTDVAYNVWDEVIPAVYLEPGIMTEVETRELSVEGGVGSRQVKLLLSIDEKAFWNEFVEVLETTK